MWRISDIYFFNLVSELSRYERGSEKKNENNKSKLKVVLFIFFFASETQKKETK